ncbi:hypothetical protein BH23ACT11_BH23ACT11_02500 [soil metagenome]
MAQVERNAHVVWEGVLMKGSGTFSGGSGAVEDLPVNFASRVQRADGKPSPEGLIASADATCYAMALSHTLAQNDSDPEKLTVDAVCTLDDEQLKVITVELNAVLEN